VNLNKKLFLLIVIAISMRVIFLYPVLKNPELSIHNDTSSYEKIAENLISGNGYSHCESAIYYTDVIRTPTYPFFLATLYSCIHHSNKPVVLIQILLGVFTVIMIYYLSRSIFTERIGFISGLLVGIDGHLITYNGVLTTETLFTFLLVLVLLLVYSKKKMAIYFLGPLLTLWILTRPIALYLIPFIIFGAILYWRQTQRLNKERIQILGLSMMMGIIMFFPWGYKYYNTTGHIGISAISSYNLYLTFANSHLAYTRGINENDNRELLIKNMENTIYNDCSNDYRYIMEMNKKGRSYLLNNFWSYALYHLKSTKSAVLPEVTILLEKWNYTQGNRGTLAVLNTDGILAGVKHYFKNFSDGLWVVLPLTFFWILTAGGFVYGLLISKEKKITILIMLIIFYFLIIPGPASTPRFLTPVVPFICIISGLGIDRVFHTIRNRLFR
jgi:4-amino-4-deoxy-L-arabinose transferase-like glycosyltransferase